MEFYSIIDKKKFSVPDSQVKYVNKGNRRFAVASYVAKKNGKKYDAYRIVAKK